MEKLEDRVRCPYGLSFEDVFSWFREEEKKYNRDVLLYTYFNDVYLDSEMTEDELYLAYFGLTKEEKRKRDEIEAIEHRKECEKRKAETKKIIEEWKKKIIEEYGSEENYRQSLINEWVAKGDEVIEPEKKERWKKIVEENIDHTQVLAEVLFYLKSFKTVDKPRKLFPNLKRNLNDSNHSGTIAYWIMSTVEEFGGKAGKDFRDYIRG